MAKARICGCKECNGSLGDIEVVAYRSMLRFARKCNQCGKYYIKRPLRGFELMHHASKGVDPKVVTDEMVGV